MDLLVGRDWELLTLERLLNDARAGSTSFAAVTGEPGIGKTSLLARLVRKAEERGALAFLGRAAEIERELPFGLFIDALDPYLESMDPGSFGGLAPEDRAELAAVFPALMALDPGGDEPSTAAERVRAHRAVRHLLESLAARQPLALLLDDLHWADGASLELVAHLLRRPPRGPVLVALAFRTGQVDGAIEAAVRGSDLVQRLALGPLAPADARELVEGAGATEHERLYRASGGNPFYMLQLARMGDPDRNGAPGGGDDYGGVPATVVAAIVEELGAVSASARHLAEAAAVAGDPFELDLTIQIAGVAEPDALDALDELVARDLVRFSPVPRRFDFRHPLVRQAVYESSPPGRRIAAHQRGAEALAERGAPLAVRAHHVQHAARHGDLAGVAVLRAAGQATAHRAPESAARWFDIALDLLPRDAPAGGRLELLMALAKARAATGRFEDSRAALLESIELTSADDEATRAGLIGACARMEQLLGHHEEAHVRLTAALERLPGAASPQTVELLIHMATGDFYREDYVAMRDTGERALTAARAVGDVGLIAASTAAMTLAWAVMGVVPEAETRRREATALVDDLPDGELALRLDAVANLSAAELYLHRYDEAAAHARRGLAIGHATGQGEISPVLTPVLSAALHLSGHIAESAELLDGAVDGARLSGNVAALGWNLLSRAFTAVAAGDLDLALEVSRESVEITRGLDDTLVTTNAGLALAGALFETGEPERAADVLVTAAGGEGLPLVPGGWRANYFELLTRCWLALGRHAEAEEAAARAAAIAHQVGLELANAMADRAAAAVALGNGDAATAAELALAAASAADRSGARVDAALARTLAGRALARHGARDRAVVELERAAGELDACGAVRYRKQAEHELRKLGRAVHRRTRPGRVDASGVGTLTEREVEIARLVVDRRTNSEIAAELFLSVKTVETHLRNIFGKLGVSSRVAVARAVERADRAIA